MDSISLYEYGSKASNGLIRRFWPLSVSRSGQMQIISCHDGSYVVFVHRGQYPNFNFENLDETPIDPDVEKFCENRVSSLDRKFLELLGDETIFFEVFRGTKLWSKLCAFPVILKKEEKAWEIYTQHHLTKLL